MFVTRRTFLQQAGIGTGVAMALTAEANQNEPLPILDTHQHLWDRSRFTLPWLQEAPEVLRQNYGLAEYREATRGLSVRAIYMEVDVAPEQKLAEAEYVAGVARQADSGTMAAIVGGLPASAGFRDYVTRLVALGPVIKGVRQVLHNPGTRQGFCLQEAFLAGIRLLGDRQLTFDLCMRPTELMDAVRLTEACPDTRFVLDHCGNADPKAFRRGGAGEPASHEPDAWRRAIEACARRPNMACKISGIVARAPRGWTAEDLAPIVNHCLDSFGPDRVVFGGDWPVCLLGATFRQWVDALRQIVAGRSIEQQRKLWSENARRVYRV